MKLNEQIKIGDKLRLYFSGNNMNNKLYHVRGFVDDQVVVRYWVRARWNYEVLSRLKIDCWSEYLTIE